MKLVNTWRNQSWSVHAIMASIFWGAIGGLILVWPALMTVIPLWAFIAGGVVLSAALAAAKFLHRPGAD